MTEMEDDVHLSVGHESHEGDVMFRAFAAMLLAGLVEGQISDVLGWTPGRLAQFLDKHGPDIAEEQSKIRVSILSVLDVEELVKAHLASLVNTAYLLYQDMMHGGSPPGFFRPYTPLGEVSPADRAKAAQLIMSLGLRLGKDVVDVATLEPPSLPNDNPTTLTRKKRAPAGKGNGK